MSAWTVISHQELGSAQATITFSSIDQIYTDLALLISARSSATNSVRWRDGYINPNGSTANATVRELYGYDTTVGTQTLSRLVHRVPDANSTASTFGNTLVYIPNYTGSTNKSFSIEATTEHNGTDPIRHISAGLWSLTNAITSLTLTLDSGNYATYSSFTLYGITKGSSGGVTVS